MSYRYGTKEEGTTTGRIYAGLDHRETDSTLKLTGTIVTSQMIFETPFIEIARPVQRYASKNDKDLFLDKTFGRSFMGQHHRTAFIPWLLGKVVTFNTAAEVAWKKRFLVEVVKEIVEGGHAWQTAVSGRHIDDFTYPEWPSRSTDQRICWRILAKYEKLYTEGHLPTKDE